MNGIYVLIPIWGERYVRRWLDLSLPSLLADGNLPALARRYPIKTLLYTTPEDMAVILAAPAVRALRDICPLRILPIAASRDEAVALHGGSVMTGCHKAGLIQSFADDHGVLPLVGDSVFSEGCLAAVADRIAAGKRAVVTQAFGVSEDAFMLALDSAGLNGRDVLSIPPRMLVRMMMQAMHPAFASKFWDAPNFSSHPHMMMWRLGAQGFLMRCWHLYPLFIYPDRKALMRGSVDDNLIEVGLSNPAEQCAALDDSDHGVLVDVLDPEKRDDPHSLQTSGRAASVEAVAEWAEQWTRPIHWDSVRRHRFWIHDEELDRSVYRSIEAESDRLVDDIASRVAALGRPTGTALFQ